MFRRGGQNGGQNSGWGLRRAVEGRLTPFGRCRPEDRGCNPPPLSASLGLGGGGGAMGQGCFTAIRSNRPNGPHWSPVQCSGVFSAFAFRKFRGWCQARGPFFPTPMYQISRRLPRP